MKTNRIFLASSSELDHERDLATAAIADFVSLHPEHNVDFRVVKWENFAATFEDARKQDQYNASIATCEVFLMLFWTKVGRYTKEEYDLAHQSLSKYQKPLLLLLEKIDGADKETSVDEFKKEVPHGNGLFSATFKNEDGLKSGIKEELQKLFKDGFLKKGAPAKLLSPNGAANPNVFIGREDELKEIRKRLDNCGKLMLINAEGGIGKTTLAAKYWNESLHDYKHNAWLFCDNGIVNALKELAPKLNLDLAGMDETQQIAALKHALSNVHDDFLLVLDNANDDEDIRVFRQTFEGFHWHVLITSRCQGVLDKEQELPITHLPPPLAKALFEQYYKEEGADFEALLDRLLEAIRYHTLLIEIFAKNMCESAELGIKMADFLQKLEKEGLHLGKHSFEIKTDYTIAVKAKAATTDEILDALYDFSKLNEEQRFLLVNLAFLPAEPYTLPFINSLLANDSDRTDLDLRNTLKSLSKKGWVAQTENTYRLSPVVQDLLLHKNKETLGVDAQDLLDKLNQLFELNTEENYLQNIQPNEVPFYIGLIPHLTKCLIKYPSCELAIVNSAARIVISDTKMKLTFSQYFNAVFDSLFKDNPDNLGYKFNLAFSYELIAEDLIALNNLNEAFDYEVV
ncbi:MAG: NB-ARC domain-containing protein [Arcicella sp.]|jgi:hypothetical protein|nr:NB-ARC domain-containing protein [Arcicella sp.]